MFEHKEILAAVVTDKPMIRLIGFIVFKIALMENVRIQTGRAAIAGASQAGTPVGIVVTFLTAVLAECPVEFIIVRILAPVMLHVAIHARCAAVDTGGRIAIAEGNMLLPPVFLATQIANLPALVIIMVIAIHIMEDFTIHIRRTTEFTCTRLAIQPVIVAIKLFTAGSTNRPMFIVIKLLFPLVGDFTIHASRTAPDAGIARHAVKLVRVDPDFFFAPCANMPVVVLIMIKNVRRSVVDAAVHASRAAVHAGVRIAVARSDMLLPPEFLAARLAIPPALVIVILKVTQLVVDFALHTSGAAFNAGTSFAGQMMFPLVHFLIAVHADPPVVRVIMLNLIPVIVMLDVAIHTSLMADNTSTIRAGDLMCIMLQFLPAIYTGRPMSI